MTDMTEAKKPTADYVTRIFHWRDVDNAGRIRRIVTVKYEYDRPNKTVKYGASIYKPEYNEAGTMSSMYKKDAHNQTADGRLKVRPKVLSSVEDNGKLVDLHEYIRKQIYKYGVGGERVHNNTDSE